MPKYVKLNPEKTKWESALFNVKPNPLKRHPDSRLPEFDWYTAKEHREPLKDRDLYHHERSGWELIDSVVHVYYTSEPVGIEHARNIMCSRINQYRDNLISQPIDFNGHEIDGSDKTIRRIMGLYVKSLDNPDFTTEWIDGNNNIITLDSTLIRELGDAFAKRESGIVLHARSVKDWINEHAEPHTLTVEGAWDFKA